MTREDLEILEGTPAADAIRAAQQVGPAGACSAQPVMPDAWALLRTLTLLERTSSTSVHMPLSRVQHVRGYFEAALPALSALTEAFPDDILPEYVSEEAFLWAAQLWYSYGMEVRANPEFPALCH